MARLLAIGDCHGEYSKLVLVLKKAKLIDDTLNWCGRKDTLVTLGDVIDRGESSFKVIELLIRIKSQASESGGRVVTIMGNHETVLLISRHSQQYYNSWMNWGGYECVQSYKHVLTNKYNDVDYRDHKNAKKIYEYHYKYFDQLEEFKIIGDYLFVHAGVSPMGDLKSLTAGTQTCKMGVYHLWAFEEFFKYKGPRFIENYGVKKIIFGHTDTSNLIEGQWNGFPDPQEVLEGQALGIDTGSGLHPLGRLTMVELFDDLSWKVVASE